MRRFTAVSAALLLLALVAAPAAAVTKGGTPDAGEHPMVGQLLFFVPDAPTSLYPDPGGWFSCSGTLVSATVVVTAGHCAFAVGLDGASTTTEENRFTAEGGNGSGGNDVWFTINEGELLPDGTVDHWEDFPATFDADGNLNFPTQQARYEARRDWANGNSFWTGATSFPHPLYDDLAFYIHDAGVIVLDEGLSGTFDYATIAGADYLQKYAGARNEHRFEVVGYGLNKVLPFADVGGDIRMKAEPKLNNLVSNPMDTYIILSNNVHTGGTCFGDSGGPTFDTTDAFLLVAVTSFGFSPNCTGVGGAYRLDQPDDLAFLAGFGITP